MEQGRYSFDGSRADEIAPHFSRMIAVMTMNVGYFMSVLAGIFLGSLVFGHYMAKSAAT